mmetsp:Transcript_60363/g.148489  ORF Transcript_60363/g.148489 Transcript_60363/m.148489 type:complete len:206 (-) Transcript_60363:318-935(-)
MALSSTSKAAFLRSRLSRKHSCSLLITLTLFSQTAASILSSSSMPLVNTTRFGYGSIPSPGRGVNGAPDPHPLAIPAWGDEICIGSLRGVVGAMMLGPLREVSPPAGDGAGDMGPLMYGCGVLAALPGRACMPSPCCCCICPKGVPGPLVGNGLPSCCIRAAPWATLICGTCTCIPGRCWCWWLRCAAAAAAACWLCIPICCPCP